MLQKFKQHIADSFPFLKDKKLLIAISGGVDSVVLTRLFLELGYSIALAHCNFKLREKESDLDESFVIELGNKLKLKTFTTQFKTQQFSEENKLSTQVAARDLRYKWFKELLKENHFDYILTGHHADDNLETFLINLTRGTGLEGLTGIPATNGNVVRPLLVFSRDEILAYAKENQIDWREDQSNSETKYLRNKIRHTVIPTLKEINPNLLKSFEKTSGFLQESEQIIKNKIKELRLEVITQEKSNIKIDIEKLQKLPNVKAYLYHLLKDYGFTEWNDINDLLIAQSGKQVFSKTHRLLKDRTFLILSESKTIPSDQEGNLYVIQENEFEINEPISLKLEPISKIGERKDNCIYVDGDLLKFPLSIRKWQHGDYFYPSGMRGKKKLSKYFKDEKFSLLEKENSWLLCNSGNEIIWIVGKRQDNQFLATNKTTNILKITY